MQRIRKDSETLSNSGHSTISRQRRESDRLRSDLYSTDNPSSMAHRNISNQSIIRDAKTKIYRLPQNPTSMAGSTPNENKSLLLASGN
jgi:hypothetical protein